MRQIYLDLDRTLLDTNAYLGDLWQRAERLVPGAFDPAAEAARLAEFYVDLNGQGTYTLHGHLRDVLGEEGLALADELLAEGFDYSAEAFLYEGVHEALGYLATKGELKVVTFGFAGEQAAKLRRLPSLAELPHDIVQIGRVEYLARALAGSAERGLLVDDKRYMAPLPNCDQIVAAYGSHAQLDPDPAHGLWVVQAPVEIVNIFEEAA